MNSNIHRACNRKLIPPEFLRKGMRWKIPPRLFVLWSTGRHVFVSSEFPWKTVSIPSPEGTILDPSHDISLLGTRPSVNGMKILVPTDDDLSMKRVMTLPPPC